MTEKYTLMMGNPVDGVTLEGIFESSEEAANYAECHKFIRDGDWWVVRIEPRDDETTITSWQPIETAPLDKGDLWVCGLAKLWSNSDELVWQGQAGFDPDSVPLWWTTHHDDEGKPLRVKATHWMPLPDLPEEYR